MRELCTKSVCSYNVLGVVRTSYDTSFLLLLHKLKNIPAGAVCGNRAVTPPLSQKHLAGEVQSVTSDSFMAMNWCDTQDVRMLCTIHSDEIVSIRKQDWKTKRPITKLKCIVDYSCKMGGVDQTDMLLSYVQCIHKSVKWYKKLALHIMNVALLSTHALYLMHNQKGTLFPDFQMSIIGGLL
jgi:hypothetical protein